MLARRSKIKISMFLLMITVVCGPKRGEPSKISKIIRLLEEIQVRIFSKKLLDTVEDMNGRAVKTNNVVFSFTL